MSNLKLVMAALVLLLIFFGFVIVAPVLEQNRALELAAIDAPISDNEEVTTPEALKNTDLVKTIEFDLKYDKYLVPEPYTYEMSGTARVFQFEKMIQALEKVEAEASQGELTYIDNYKDRNGRAPAYRGKSVDAAGNNRSASAPGYPDSSDREEFEYLADGTLVRVLEELTDLIRVEMVENGKQYFVPSRYVRTDDPLTSLNKGIVVDRQNQNIASFEKRTYGGNMGHARKTRWTVVSYSLATTGKVGKYHQPTPLGYYYAIEKRERFFYVKDGTEIIEGYAPYAVRFSAGAYVHGVATAYTYTENGARLDPGFQEFSHSIGTIPLSHKCVRNYTSHAKFIYDWYTHGETIVIVIE